MSILNLNYLLKTFPDDVERGIEETPEYKTNLYLTFKSAITNEMHHQICDGAGPQTRAQNDTMSGTNDDGDK